MKRRIAAMCGLFALVIPMVVGCIPDTFKIETTSELGPNTLSRIDDLNDMLDRGIEIGPETRATIEELNQTIRDGINFGFTDATLDRVDRLLGIVEQGVGVKLGLDSETNATVNRLIDTLNTAPGQWEGTMTEIIQTLEGSTSNVASHMADEVRDLMDDARLNTQYVTAAVGVEFRCNVDFLGARAGDTVDQFIGRTIIGRLRAIVSGEPEAPSVPIPWVCQIIPDQINLIETTEGLVFEDAVVKISGYNYVQENLPTAYIVDEAGEQIESYPLYPFLSSPYQLQLNLQSIDFSAIPARSRVVFGWPTAGTNYALSMVFPEEEIVPTEIPQAALTISAPSVDVRKGPGERYNTLGRAEVGAEYPVTGQNGAGDWWQIDYDGYEGWVPDSVVTRNEVSAPVVSIPLPPPSADFLADPSSGYAPLEVSFTDLSSGSPFRWEWDFGEGAPVFEQNPSHTYENVGTYQVKLRVENDLGYGTVSKTIDVTEGMVWHPVEIPLLPFIPLLPVPTPSFPNGSILFANFTNLGENVHRNTSIHAGTYDCGIVSMAAMNGDIRESGTGNIMWANMAVEGDTWWINANFRTHNNDETWYIGVMCLNKTLAQGYKFYRRVRVEPASDETVDLEHLNIPENYHCGVVGMAAWTGDIDEVGSGEHIIKAFTKENTSTGNWELTANFRSHITEEHWDIDLLCVYNNPSIFLFKSFYQKIGNAPFDTGVSSSQYACGIDGMAGLNGDINENDTGNILKAYTYIGPGGNWFVVADFRSHYNHEHWDINLICARRPAAMVSGNWGLGWVP